MAARNSKYDRQLRIWGDKGQLALEQASVCLLNCGPTGTEALKNLVLGGVGSITIVDQSIVTARDLGNNFFVDWESKGYSKAQSVCTLLRELNDTVKADFVEESAEVLLESNPSFFSRFSLVIATQMTETFLLKIDAICRQHNVMLLIARSYGLTGLVRISVKEHCVVESKPDNVLDDLRLHKPWEELKRFVDEFNQDIDDPLVHKHIPFGVLLIKASEQWRKYHGGKLPSTSKEKAEFKSMLSSARRAEDEDNYKEALASAYKVWSPPRISSELQKILNDSQAEVHSSSSDFWVMVAALKDFIAHEGEGDLPLDGSIPDMTSLTGFYIKLQKIYQNKAELDVLALETRVKLVLKRIGKDCNSISRATIKQFSKNAHNLQVCRYPTLEDEYHFLLGPELQKMLWVEENRGMSGAELVMGGDAMDKSSFGHYYHMDINVSFYLLFRGVDRFASLYNHYPGVYDGDLEEDTSNLKSVMVSLLSKMGIRGASISDDLVGEMCRFGASEIHNVASVIGGIASQEAIKLLTKQFTPLPGTLIYNGINSTTTMLCF